MKQFLRWHYPDQVNGSDLTSFSADGSAPRCIYTIITVMGLLASKISPRFPEEADLGCEESIVVSANYNRTGT